MTNTKKNILSLMLSFVLVFSLFAFLNTDYSYAIEPTIKINSINGTTSVGETIRIDIHTTKTYAVQAADVSISNNNGTTVFSNSKSWNKSDWNNLDYSIYWNTTGLNEGTYYVTARISYMSIGGMVPSGTDTRSIVLKKNTKTEDEELSDLDDDSDITLNAPKISSLKAKNGKVTVKWKDVDIADAYEIKIGSKNYFTEENKITSKALTGGKTYLVKIRSVYVTDSDEEIYSKWSSAKKIKVPKYKKIKTVSSSKISAPKIIKETNCMPCPDLYCIGVFWKKVRGASGYYVYHKIGDGNWKKFATVKGKNNCYVDDDVEQNTTVQYKIKTYVKKNGKIYTSKYSSIIKARALDGVTIHKPEYTSESRTAIISWEPVEGATSYRVEYAKYDKYDYTSAGTFSGTSAKITVPQTKVKYEIHVIPICENGEFVTEGMVDDWQSLYFEE